MTTLSALLAAYAAYVWVGPPPRIDRGRTRAGRTAPHVSPAIGVAVLIAVASITLLGFGVGVVVALVAAPVGAHVVGRLESAEARRRRERVERDMPLMLDLTVAALEAGQSSAGALRLAGHAMGGPLGDDLAEIAGRLELGRDPELLWGAVGRNRSMAPLSRAFVRAGRSGASATRVLRRAADELRQQRRASAQERAQSVGVKTAAPLGLCFLPAFVLIGIVPTIISAFQGITW